jgi:hypothetical protein
MTLHERADKLLALREDLYEMHFHQVDREWLIEAMIDFSMQLPKQEMIDQFIDFQIYIHTEGLITNHDWDFENVAKKYIKSLKKPKNN